MSDHEGLFPRIVKNIGALIEDEEGNPVFDGVEYQSAMATGGANLAIFYPNKLECIDVTTFEVTKLVYQKDPIAHADSD